MASTVNRPSNPVPINRLALSSTLAQTNRRLLLMVGGAAGVVGALLAFVANALHPHPNYFQLEALLQAIALSATWGPIHLVLIFSLVLILGALLALTLTLDSEPAATVARFACLATLLGGALMLVSTAMDGFAMNQIARLWWDAAPSEKASALRIAAAAEDLQYAVYSLSGVIFLGLGIFLYGLTMILSRAYPRPLGWLALVSGAGAFVVGIAQVLGGPEFRATEVFDVLFSILSTVWLLITGVLMWRKAREETVDTRA